jgi:hypothetical protein
MLRTILVILVLSLGSVGSAWALKIVGQPENAVELTLANVTLPTGVTGAVQFRTCEDCKAQSLPVSSNTKYLVNNREVRREDFLLAGEGIRGQRGAAATTFVGVYYDVASQHVNRIALTRPR